MRALAELGFEGRRATGARPPGVLQPAALPKAWEEGGDSAFPKLMPPACPEATGASKGSEREGWGMAGRGGTQTHRLLALCGRLPCSFPGLHKWVLAEHGGEGCPGTEAGGKAASGPEPGCGGACDPCLSLQLWVSVPARSRSLPSLARRELCCSAFAFPKKKPPSWCASVTPLKSSSRRWRQETFLAQRAGAVGQEHRCKSFLREKKAGGGVVTSFCSSCFQGPSKGHTP